MKITIETLNTMSKSAIMELFYNQFLSYGKKSAMYIASKHDMSHEYCAMYIASGLYMLLTSRIDQLKENNADGLNDNEILLYAFLGTKKLVKKIMSVTNYSSYFKNNEYAYNSSDKTLYKMDAYKKSKNQYSEYRNIKKVNPHVIDIIDVLEQKENRTNKKNLSIDDDLFDGVSFRDSLISYYDTPEQALLKKLSRAYSTQYADKIRSDKKYNRLCFIFDKIKNDVNLANSEIDFLYNFKKRHGLEVLTSKELFYIVSNY